MTWDETTKELAEINAELCTFPIAKEQTKEHLARLVVLRARCIELHHERIQINAALLKGQEVRTDRNVVCR